MTAADPNPALAQAREAFDALVRDIRPQLHRYCARMTGSVVDAEDVVQDALAKAYYSLSTTPVANLRGWLFRIAHNEAIDHLRRSGRHQGERLDDYPSSGEQESALEERELAAMALSLFVKLAPLQRSCVIMKDVMGYSLAEISELLDVSVNAVKAALHRGRTALRELSRLVEDSTPLTLEGPQATLLAAYVERFNARDFGAVRDMLADDVRLDLVGKAKGRGIKEVENYFHNYGDQGDWHLACGLIEGRPAILISDPGAPSAGPGYFVLIDWVDGHIGLIRDYRYARHVMSDAAVGILS